MFNFLYKLTKNVADLYLELTTFHESVFMQTRNPQTVFKQTRNPQTVFRQTHNP